MQPEMDPNEALRWTQTKYLGAHQLGLHIDASKIALGNLVEPLEG